MQLVTTIQPKQPRYQSQIHNEKVTAYGYAANFIAITIHTVISQNDTNIIHLVLAFYGPNRAPQSSGVAGKNLIRNINKRRDVC